MNDEHVPNYHGFGVVSVFAFPSGRMYISSKEKCNVGWANPEEFVFFFIAPKPCVPSMGLQFHK